MGEYPTASLINEYDTRLKLYEACTASVESLVKTILRTRDEQIHSVSSRVKDRDSYLKKVSRKEGKYRSISDITDVAGIRVITYFHDDVDRIAAIIASEFELDLPNCVDKRASHANDSFGYMSLHYVASFSTTRSELPEYSSYKDIKFEIQIRSILQHAWAEIEHDRGYHNAMSLPPHISRRFSRLAGHLEIGDSEFAQIRDAIEAYKGDVAEKLTSNPQSIELDEVSITLFIHESQLVRKLDERLANIFSLPLTASEEIAMYILRALHYCKYRNILEVENDLEKNQAQILTYCELIKDEELDPYYYLGGCILYMATLKQLEIGTVESMIKYMDYVSLADEEERRNKAVHRVQLYKSMNAQVDVVSS